ncbi:hypothetical protein HHK36_027737 [Tetracentron sinense]|uniref:PAR1 protein n=1 Tax=Tetracentron sinense TaxID=13715 RepID=A0A834YEH8_TETSI|nr:hypothetical protein HHK36_027737 [Tetracentron sinense]
MASHFSFKTLAILAFALFQSVQGTLGGINCEHLNKESCAFAVSSGGTRCVLEKQVRRSGEEVYTCGASRIEAGNLKDWIETDQCVEACGVDRNSLGISTDSLLDSQFTQKLCSTGCYNSCSNIVDLYFNLAAGEGVFLPKLCEAQGANARRIMAEIHSSGSVAPGPKSELPANYVVAQAMAPY